MGLQTKKNFRSIHKDRFNLILYTGNYSQNYSKTLTNLIQCVMTDISNSAKRKA